MAGEKTPFCSICIANYNGAKTLRACLDSVFEQHCDVAFEVLVHDDASTDGSAEIVQREYPRAQLMRSAVNVGFCESNNRMVGNARGEYLLLLNNDACLHPGALEALSQRSRASTTGTVLTLRQYALPEGKLMDAGSLFDPFLNPVPNKDFARSKIGMGMGACLWIPRDVWNEVGGFPAFLGSLAEDLYLCLAAWLLGYRVEALPVSGYDHWVGASFGGGKITDRGLRTTFRRRRLSERNKTLVMTIVLPLRLLAVILPAHLVLLAIEGIALSALRLEPRYWTEIYGPCLAAPWRERKLVAWHRRRLHAKAPRGKVMRLLSLMRPMPYKLVMLLRHGLPRLS